MLQYSILNFFISAATDGEGSNVTMAYNLGIDVGSTTVKVTVLNEDAEVLYTSYERHFSRVRDYMPDYFVNQLLRVDCNTKLAVCGFNFRFGKGGLGDCDTLCELMGSENCIVVPPVYRAGHLVSSSAIRLLISAGEMELAAELLTRPFFIDFPVVHGKQLGRTIGIPTINQEFPEGHVIPKNGIYACTVEIADDIFLGVANVGVRPTVDNGSEHINCETHIINYNGWLYGKNIKVSFYKRIRDEIKFPSVDELRAQIKRDIASAIDYFSKK